MGSYEFFICGELRPLGRFRVVSASVQGCVYNDRITQYLSAVAPHKNAARTGDFALERLVRATVNTWNGLIAATRSEQAFREELVVLALAVPLAFFVGTDRWKALTLIAVILMVLVVELLNTAIEKISDFVAPARDERIGRIKDMGSAAVGVAIIAAALIWFQAIAERFGWF
jgi:diacylglycerol kinase (ATP)